MYDDVLGVRATIDGICLNDMTSRFKLITAPRVKSC
jgi:hypothetical protein